jgi:murein DD-endopeptidase MepM/ murein hydrolase activator NlpD
MEQAACWSRLSRGALLIAAAAIVSALGGCSSSFSRFDFPAFNMTSSDASAGSPQSPQPQPQAQADLSTTSSLPIPEESVYASSDTRSGVARASLPPVPQSSPAPRVTPASYSPLPNSQPHMQKVAFAGATPHAEPAVLRVSDEPVASRKVKVGRGDTLSSLSKHYGVSVEAIKSANNLSDTRLTAGQELIIPAPGSHEATAQAVPDTHVTAAPPAPGWTESPRAASGATYKVQKGDTPHSIAAKNSVAEKDLLAANKLTRVNRLQIGQTLIIPDAKNATPVVAATESPASAPASAPEVHVVKTTTIPAPGVSSSEPAKAASAETAKGTGPAAVAASTEVTGPSGKDEKPSTPIASNDQLPTPEPMSGSGNSFRWPVLGRIISEFGAKPDGGHNDGIDVAVPQGTSVKAAENGVVAYAGDELKGYGNLVLVRHANNWVSAYAHNDELLVKRGDKVRRGQIIAKAGTTGSVSQPQVHFELRRGSRPVDPTKYLANAQASAD